MFGWWKLAAVVVDEVCSYLEISRFEGEKEMEMETGMNGFLNDEREALRGVRPSIRFAYIPDVLEITEITNWLWLWCDYRYFIRT